MKSNHCIALIEHFNTIFYFTKNEHQSTNIAPNCTKYFKALVFNVSNSPNEHYKFNYLSHRYLRAPTHNQHHILNIFYLQNYSKFYYSQLIQKNLFVKLFHNTREEFLIVHTKEVENLNTMTDFCCLKLIF